MGALNAKLIGLGVAGVGTIGTIGTVLLTRTIQPSIVFQAPQHEHEAYDKVGGISYRIADGGSPKSPKSTKSPKDIVIYSHGNAEDICTIDLEGLSQELQCTVVAYDYPGYGLSSGTPNEGDCIRALVIITDHIMKSYPGSNIVHVGRSLGTGVLAQYAYSNRWTAPIVLMSPFKSIGRVICDSCVTDSLSGMFRTADIIDKLVCQVKIIHGTQDSLVSCDHGRYLHGKAKYPLAPVWKQCGHNDLALLRSDIQDLMWAS